MNKQRSHKRVVDGILLLDKPLHISSNAALQKAKQLYGAQKAGHTGSLDPLASGMLPICFGEATKFCQYLLDSDKTYYVKAQLGITTTTGDREGQILEEKPVAAYTEQQLLTAMQQFRGEVKQTPPMYSALKHQGQPLYKLARQGIEVERKPRIITVYALDLLSHAADEIIFKVHCSKGTYVRSLVEDIGSYLGCGAHVSELRRLAVGSYQESAMISFQQLESMVENHQSLDSLLLTSSTSVRHLPALQVNETHFIQLRNGKALKLDHDLKPGFIRLLTTAEVFFGLAEVLTDGTIAPRRLTALSA